MVLKAWSPGSRGSNIWELVRNANSQNPPQSLQTQKFQGQEAANWFDKCSGWFRCSFKFENHWFTLFILPPWQTNEPIRSLFIPFSCPHLLCIWHFECYCHLRLTRTFQTWFSHPHSTGEETWTWGATVSCPMHTTSNFWLHSQVPHCSQHMCSSHLAVSCHPQLPVPLLHSSSPAGPLDTDLQA